MKVKTLSDLKLVKKEIEAQAKRAAEAAAEAARKKRQSATDKDLFVRAAGAVKPLQNEDRVLLKKEQTPILVMQQDLDEQAVLREAISDEFDVSTLLDVDDHMSFRRSGIGTDVTKKLRQGQWSIQRQIDLHGLRRDEAREVLSAFIREAFRHGIRCGWSTARAWAHPARRLF
jgi:DNA-nicking Smr family endonuclease